ncbi:hypothetical protein [Lacticaseibacillus porcinae]|jgi:hypothetical protein|uniref:hypothetical protein n=1 Tax=Lacticaseibacillus porcinae TaxID=1123687 RepID=UPI000F7821A3|nr:hypothetical protein [Lacticaseibacillus porcinae]
MKKYIWGIGIAVVLLASGGGYYFYQDYQAQQAGQSEFSNDDDDVDAGDLNGYTDDDTADDESDSSSESSDSESSDSESNSESSSESSESSTDESDSPETNLVYGHFDKSKMKDYVSDLKKNSAGFYQGHAGAMRITFGITNDTINVAEMSFVDSPMDLKLDASHINELTTQWMGSDAKQDSQSADGKTAVYSSATLNRVYKVDRTLNSNGELTEIRVGINN